MRPQIRVLVVDDTQHVRNMLSTMLSIDGFEVVGEACDGPSALQAVARVNPDVVVLDYKMPLMDGLETARAIKERRPDQHLILYTAFVDSAMESAAAKIGVAVCLNKVEGLGRLEQEIRRLCQGSGLGSGGQSARGDEEPASGATSAGGEEELDEGGAEDEDE